MQLTRNQDRFFDPFLAFVCSHVGITMALEAQRDGAVRAELPGDKVGYMAAIPGHTLVLEPAPILNAVARGDWLEAIPYELAPIPKALPDKKIPRTSRVHVQNAQALFAQYLDSVEDQARRQQNDPLVRFGKAIRNAAAHGGRFTGIDDRAGLNWHGKALTAADNGKTLIEVGIGFGDLIALMRELDAHIAR